MTNPEPPTPATPTTPDDSSPALADQVAAGEGSRRSVDWVTIILILAAIGLGIFALWNMVKKPAHTSTPATSAPAVASAPASQGAVLQASPSASTGGLDEAEIQRARERAHEFVTAYYSQSWKDASPSEWAGRAAAFATDDYGQKLTAEAQQQKAEDREWKRLVKAKTAMTVQDKGEYIVFSQGTDASGAPMVKLTATLMVGRDAEDALEAVKAVREVKTIVLVRDVTGVWKVADYYDALGNNNR
jgi:hypothetical protein